MIIKIGHLVSHDTLLISALVSGLSLAAPAYAQTPAPAASVAPAEPDGNPEIIVTATRREAGAQSVPLALTAIGGDQLRSVGITNAANLAQMAPSLVVNTDMSAGSPRYSLRGLSGGDITAAASPAIATYIDDVPQATQFGIGSSMFDLQRVEVLRGPQGTTFGKNTTGGAIAYFAQTPTNEAEGYVSGRLGGGDRGEQFVEGAVNLPIVDQTLAARFSFRAEERNDWLRNLGPAGGKNGGGHGYSARGQLRWTPDLDTYVNLALYLARYRGDQSPTHAEYSGGQTFPPLPALPARASRKTVDYNAYDLHDNFNNTGVTLRAGHKFGLFDLTSITHFRSSKQRIAQDLDGTSLDLFFARPESEAQQYGQEFRLASDATLPLSGVFGLFYEHDRLNERQNQTSTVYGLAPGISGPFPNFIDPDGLGPINAGDPIPVFDYNNPAYYRTITKTYAMFGNLTYKILPTLSITGGVRKTIEKKRFTGTAFYYVRGTQDWNQGNVFFDPATPPGIPDLKLPIDRSITAKPWTWDVTVDYNPTRKLLVFGRVAKGFRSGGFNQAQGAFPWSPFFDARPFIPGSGVPPFSQPPTFSGEKVQSYELGVKSSLLRWLRVNANVYHYDYSDQQVTTFPGGLLYTTNAGTSKVDGAEIEVSAYPTRRVDLNASVSYNDARYDKFLSPGDPNCLPAAACDYAGNRLNQAPRWSSNWAIAYHLPVTETHNLRMSTNWSYRSRIFFTQSNSPAQSDPSRVLGNVRLSFEPIEGEGFSIAGYVNNLTNKRPQTFGFDMAAPNYAIRYFSPGRTFGADLSYRW